MHTQRPGSLGAVTLTIPGPPGFAHWPCRRQAALGAPSGAAACSACRGRSGHRARPGPSAQELLPLRAGCRAASHSTEPGSALLHGLLTRNKARWFPPSQSWPRHSEHTASTHSFCSLSPQLRCDPGKGVDVVQHWKLEKPDPHTHSLGARHGCRGFGVCLSTGSSTAGAAQTSPHKQRGSFCMRSGHGWGCSEDAAGQVLPQPGLNWYQD